MRIVIDFRWNGNILRADYKNGTLAYIKYDYNDATKKHSKEEISRDCYLTRARKFLSDKDKPAAIMDIDDDISLDDYPLLSKVFDKIYDDDACDANEMIETVINFVESIPTNGIQ